MGIFDFVKDAGHKILSEVGDAAKNAAANVAPNNAANNTVSDDVANNAAANAANSNAAANAANSNAAYNVANQAQLAAQHIKQHLDKYNLGSDKINVKLDGDKAHLSGEVSDQAALEKAVLAVGNMLGISQVNASELKLKDDSNNLGAKNSRFYEVKRGDSLWQIAESVYGSSHGDKYKIIFEANKPMLTSADDIFPGQMLRIPNIDAA